MTEQGKEGISEQYSSPTRDHFSWVWLAVAAVILFVANRWAVPFITIIPLVFLLRFVRTQRLWLALILAWLVISATNTVANPGVIMYPGNPYVSAFFFSLLMTLSFLADRLIAPRLKGFAATLVFPTAFTTLEYLSSFGTYGSYNSIAYTQYGNLPLMQVVSLTGIWGITFLIAWFATAVNWAWERKSTWPKVRVGVLLYIGVLAVVMLVGSVRLIGSPPKAPLVRVAGISASQAAVKAFKQQLPQETLSLLWLGKATQTDRDLARSAFAIITDDLFARSQQEARSGAEIVVWPETSQTGASFFAGEDGQALINRASALAGQEGIYLNMGVALFPSRGKSPYNRAMMFDPNGKEVNITPSNSRYKLVPSQYGGLVSILSADLDFPEKIRFGAKGADLLLCLANDTEETAPVRAQKAVFRAIENGASLVREASNGFSIAVDYQGRVLATSDYFTADQQLMTANVPTQGVHTFYSTIGDWFALLCLIGLVFLIGLVI